MRAVRASARRVSARLDERIAAAGDLARRALHPDVDWVTLAISILPGLGHAREGRRRTGAFLLGIWSVLILLVAAYAGSGFAWFLGAAALGFHCMVLSLLLAPALAGMTLGGRLRFGLLIYLALVLLLYGPAILVARGCVGVLPIHGIRAAAPLADGDVILYTGRWLRPARWMRGDLVVYRVHGAARSGVVVRSGFGVDRIIGVPGDRLSYHDGTLTVNGAPVPAAGMPIGGLVGFPEFDMSLDAGEYAVLPSALRWQAHGANVHAVIERLVILASRLSEEDLAGTAWWRLRPWGRFGPLEE